MKRRSGEMQVFSMSFLDVLSCALGGTLLLLLLIQQNQQQQTEAREEAARQMQTRIEQSQQELQQTQKELEDSLKKAKSAQQKLAAVARINQKLKKAQAALVGLGGDLKNVVFIFDTSGSMADNANTARSSNDLQKGPKFIRYADNLKKGVKNYPISRFNVIRFSHTVEIWKPGQLVEATDANRDAAGRFIDTFKPNGGTATMDALQAAMKLPGVDTIILFSDGVPTPQGKTRFTFKDVDDEIRRITDWAKANHGKIVINTVAIGGTHESKHREFLRNLAKSTGGTSQAIF